MKGIERAESVDVEKVTSMVKEIAGGMLRERGGKAGIDRCELGLFAHDGTMGGKRPWADSVDIGATYELAKSITAEFGRQLDVRMEPVVSITSDILIFGGRPGPDILFDTFRA